MKKEFVLRGKTASGKQEVLNFSGHKKGYAYKMTEFVIYPSVGVGGTPAELAASVTAAKTFSDPENPDFTDQGLIAVTQSLHNNSVNYPVTNLTVINDTYLVTQNLILAVVDTQNANPVNWQCKFESVKMSGPEEAVTNYRQFLISDE